MKTWSRFVKDRAENKCEWCGATKYLNSHHIISKRHKLLRFDPNNGLCVCARCHKFGVGIACHENPIRVAIWLMEHRPEAWSRLKNHTLEVIENDNKRSNGRSNTYETKKCTH